ncbi:MAG TPA: right-handed parallel beta-helix repeat-containing protein, partial [Candidatus Krumholzibacteria bacterium]|nr:right-handed parallel beta-helix repeat-containing protein [Candidatus Krumholzibacteria bacterium]
MNSARCIVLLIAAAIIVGTTPLAADSATTHRVRQDGSGDFTTIGAAVAAAAAGDVIEVGPGTYPEQVDVYVTLSFMSTDGAAATIVDGENTHYPLWFRGGTGHSVDGFTFRRGYHVSGGGAIRCQAGATLTMRNCVMEDNVSDFDGGALFTRDAGSMIEAYDCTFIGNQAAKNGGASIAILSSTMRFTRCSFINNTGGLGAGATAVDHSRLDIAECLYVDNDATTAGAIYAYVSTGGVASSTFYSSRSETWGSVLMQDSPDIALTRNIFYGEEQTVGLAFYAFGLPYVDNAHTCNVFFNNAAGAMSGADLDASELVLDPVFCDAVNGDFTISLQSPAAPANSPCGLLVGAFSTNCDIAPPPPPPTPVVEPVILTILDVPDDQGGQVRIRWERADYDAPNQQYVITGYGIYRRQNQPLVSQPLPASAVEPGDRVRHLDGWDYIATVPARGDDIYQFVASTLCDTPKNGDPCWSHFFVSAMTPNPLVYFDSAPDSGHSVDNLPPGPPQSL